MIKFVLLFFIALVSSSSWNSGFMLAVSGEAHHVIEIYNKNHHISKSVPPSASTAQIVQDGQASAPTEVKVSYQGSPSQNHQSYRQSPKPLKTGVQYVTEGELLEQSRNRRSAKLKAMAQQQQQQHKPSYRSYQQQQQAHAQQQAQQQAQQHPQATSRNIQIYKTGERTYGSGTSYPAQQSRPYGKSHQNSISAYYPKGGPISVRSDNGGVYNNIPVQTQYITVPTAPAQKPQEQLTIVAPAKPPVFAYKTSEAPEGSPNTIQLFSDYPREPQFQFGANGKPVPVVQKYSNPQVVNTYQWVPEVVAVPGGGGPVPVEAYVREVHPQIHHQTHPQPHSQHHPQQYPVNAVEYIQDPESGYAEVDAFVPEDFFRSFFEPSAHAPADFVPRKSLPAVYNVNPLPVGYHHQMGYSSHYAPPPVHIAQEQHYGSKQHYSTPYIAAAHVPAHAQGLLPAFILAEESAQGGAKLPTTGYTVANPRMRVPAAQSANPQAIRVSGQYYQPSEQSLMNQDELKGAYSQKVESFEPNSEKSPKNPDDSKFPIRVKKELLGKQNADGKPWGQKTTLTYEDPKDPTNYVQVHEYQMTVDRTLEPESASNEIGKFIKHYQQESNNSNKNKHNHPSNGESVFPGETSQQFREISKNRPIVSGSDGSSSGGGGYIAETPGPSINIVQPTIVNNEEYDDKKKKK